MEYTKEKLKELQSLPLEDKIFLSQQRIQDWYEYWKGDVYVSFSGGKDSTALLDIARTVYPDIPAVYCDTGLEYPEVKNHAKSFDNVTIIRPKMYFNEVIKKYGWLFPSKEVAQIIWYARQGSKWAINKLDGLNADGTYSSYKQMYKKWKFLLDAPFVVGHKCCNVMKKEPFKEYEKVTGRRAILGILASESGLRLNSWLHNGCNAFKSSRPISQPLSFWTEQDILRYIKDNNIKIPSVYGDIVEVDGKLSLTGVKRTGCLYCMAGVHLDKPSRFIRLKETHPKLYEYCINKLGAKESLDFIGKEMGKELY